MKTDRQLHLSEAYANTKAYSQSGPIQRTRRPAPPWFWLKVLVIVTLVIPITIRLVMLALRHFS